MPLYRLTWTVADHGHEPENGERFLDGFISAHPEVDPVVSQNRMSGHLAVTFCLEADDLNEAVDKGARVFTEGANASGLEPSEVIDLSVALVPADEFEDAHKYASA